MALYTKKTSTDRSIAVPCFLFPKNKNKKYRKHVKSIQKSKSLCRNPRMRTVKYPYPSQLEVSTTFIKQKMNKNNDRLFAFWRKQKS